MQVVRHLLNVQKTIRGNVFAIGNFDGVHFGHRALINGALEIASSKRVPLSVLTFEPHPRSVLANRPPPFRLSSFRGKVREIGALGATALVALRFDKDLARVSAVDFVKDVIIGRLGASHVVVGYDFVFGRERSGNASLLRQMSRDLGFGLTVIEPVERNGHIFASGQIRDALRNGEVKRAASLLGRWWEIEGRVCMGYKRGTEIGFPTINLKLGDYVQPRLGIYASRVAVPEDDGTVWRNAVTYIGRRPTFNGENVVPETHIFNFNSNIYTKRARVALIRFIRDDRHFDDIDTLRKQINVDCEDAMRTHDNPPSLPSF
tara:strand:+ start:26 stop:982 length:957 start_codon:yes stop_codon:yes gene_type:complete